MDGANDAVKEDNFGLFASCLGTPAYCSLFERVLDAYKGSRCIHSPGHAHLSACSHMMVPDVTSIATSLSGFEVAHWRWARRPVLGQRHFDEDCFDQPVITTIYATIQ